MSSFSQIQITAFGADSNTVYNYSQIIEPAFLGSEYDVFNIEYTGSNYSIACFQADSGLIGVTNGILLSTGIAEQAIDYTNSINVSTDVGTLGTSLFSPAVNYDAAILEFDFVASVDSLVFKYVFGSEEYLEYVETGFNDMFGIFISGSGFSGQENIALLPNSVAVSIDNIHSAGTNVIGNIFGAINESYYVSNSSASQIGLDGYTVPLKAFASVIPGETYHLVVAIADVGDGVKDSGVFIENCNSCACTIDLVRTPILFESMTCYPNPSNGSFNIQLPTEQMSFKSSKLLIYNVLGEIVVDRPITSIESKLSVSGLSSGTYSVIVVDGSSKWSERIVIGN